MERSPRAKDDLVDIAAHIGRDSDAAEATIADLGSFPHLGRVRSELADERLAGMRSMSIRGFENHLVFYLVSEERVLVVRVIHGARDLPAQFEGRDPG